MKLLEESFFKGELVYDYVQRRNLWRLTPVDKEGNALSGGIMEGYKYVDCFYVNPENMVKAEYLFMGEGVQKL